MTSEPPRFDEAFRARLEELFRWRRDVRRFRRDPIDRMTLEQLLRTSALAPSVGNSQPWRFVVVDDPTRRARVRDSFLASNADALAGYAGERAKLYASLKLSGLDSAPIQLAVCIEPDTEAGDGLGRRTMPETVSYSAVLSVHTLWLAARARGIGVGWLSILDPSTVMQALDVDAGWSLVAYLCLGLPDEEHLDAELERHGWQARLDPSVFVIAR